MHFSAACERHACVRFALTRPKRCRANSLVFSVIKELRARSREQSTPAALAGYLPQLKYDGPDIRAAVSPPQSFNCILSSAIERPQVEN